MSSLISSITTSLQLVWDILVSVGLILFGNSLPKLTIDPVDLTNKTAIVTGADSGIGYSLALI